MRALATLLAALALGACAAPPPAPRNLVFISLDTTRRDHLSVYGYDRATAPTLAALAETSLVVESAVSQMPTTNPSHSSMFTGLYPHTHGVGSNTRALPDEAVTLAEILTAAGFETGGFVGGYPLRERRTGIDQGFRTYDGDFPRRRRDGAVTTDLALDWLDGIDPEERFFLFLHFYDAHGPYRPDERTLDLFRSPEPGPTLPYVPNYQQRNDADGEPLRRLDQYVDRYDAMLRIQDECVARLLERVDLSDTLVVVTADHGESLGERALVLDHGKGLWEEQMSIPLLVHAPGYPARRVDALVETVDLLPTLAEMLEVPLPEGLRVEGESFAPLIRGERDEHKRLAFSSTHARSQHHADRGYRLDEDRFIVSVRSRRWKLIRYPALERHDYVELYDLGNDPGETVDVANGHPEVVERLLAALAAWEEGPPATGGEEDLSEEELENLRALGYVD